MELALFGGAILNGLPIALILLRPDWTGTRHTIAVTQMLWSAVFVHLTGGRIETHFHIFGSLAFLSFYRDPRVLITATLVVAADHLLLGFFWPESVYGIANPEWWRFLEHAGWVIFEDIVLVLGCRKGVQEMQILSDREATLEVAKGDVERQVADRTDELRASGERYRTLIENTSALPWEMEGDSCRIVYVAPQMTTIFGVTPDRLAARQVFLDVLHPDDRQAFKDFVRHAARGDAGETHHIDSRVLGTEGQVTHVRSYVSEQGGWERTGNIFGMSLDITRQKRLELDLSQAQKLESIGQLAAGIAHEINTPTQFIGDNIRFLDESVGGILAVLRRLAPYRAMKEEDSVSASEVSSLLADVDVSYLGEELPKAIAQSLEGVERISKIVGAMKEFSHPAVDRTLLDLNRAISSTITVASNEWKYVADVVSDFDPALPQVPVMPGAFNQVILNILVNAAHAIGSLEPHSPTPKGTITVSTRKVDDFAEIRVRDTGGGIPDNIRDRIFDPFFTTKPVGKGTGQGLAIAHDVVVKKHQGSISVESQPGIGTTFIIRLPLHCANAEPARAA